jgi:hypothetical protein
MKFQQPKMQPEALSTILKKKTKTSSFTETQL